MELVILNGPQAGRRLPVGSEATTLGRRETATFFFPYDNFISGTHLSVQAGPQGVWLTDLRSYNGTFLNEQRITQALAKAGDIVRIGELSFQVITAQAQPSEQAVLAPHWPESATLSGGMANPPSSPLEIPLTGQPINNLPHTGGTIQLPTLGRNFGNDPRAIPAPAISPFERVPTPSPAAATQTFIPPAVLPHRFPGKPTLERVMEILTSTDLPLYCLLDAAVDPQIEPELIRAQIEPLPHNLYDGESAVSLASWAPYLVPLPPASPLLPVLLDRGWGKAWASYFISTATFDELRKHFRKFLMVQIEGGDEVYFRFYDPRVLRDFLPTTNLQELMIFFGPVHEWLLEGEISGTLLRLRNSPGGLQTNVVAL